MGLFGYFEKVESKNRIGVRFRKGGQSVVKFYNVEDAIVIV